MRVPTSLRRERPWVQRQPNRFHTTTQPSPGRAFAKREDETVDADLSESVSALKLVFQERFIPANFVAGDPTLLEALSRALPLPDRYLAFLKGADPVDVETATPPERVRLIPAAELEMEQIGYSRGDAQNPATKGWHPGWIVIAHSALLGDPYFLDTTRPDAEGDCPVMTAMSGAGLNPILCASNFVCFIKILTAAMELASDFSDESHDPDDEFIFREALGSRIKVIDHAALRDKHWTT
jgi:hypothetical protein